MIGVGLGCVWFGWASTTFSQPVATGPTTTPTLLDFAPVSYFQDNCARCHGSYGQAYESGMAARYTDQELREKVDTMASGPAQAPLAGAALDAVLEYQKSLNASVPFVHLASVGEGATPTISGEVTPGAKVVVTVGDTRADATVDGHTWKVVWKESVDVKNVRVDVK